MRLARISVEGLFGVFHHDIRLNLDERISIISGPNGSGKTIILRMVHALLTGRLGLLRSVPFSRFRVEFDDGSAIEATQRSGSKAPQMPSFKRGPGVLSLPVQVSRIDRDGKEAAAPGEPLKVSSDVLREIDAYIPGLHLSGSFWRSPTGERYSPEEVIAKYEDTIRVIFAARGRAAAS